MKFALYGGISKTELTIILQDGLSVWVFSLRRLEESCYMALYCALLGEIPRPVTVKIVRIATQGEKIILYRAKD
jgi:hypothetical protein